MGGLSLESTMAVLLLLLPLAYGHLHSTLGVHPTGVSYSDRSPQGLHGYHHHGLLAVHGYGKREAEAHHGYGLVAAYHPTHHAIGYGVHHHGFSWPLHQELKQNVFFLYPQHSSLLMCEGP